MANVIKTESVSLDNSHDADVGLIVRLETRPRQGWDEQFQRMARLGDDSLLDRKDLSASSWDETEWQW